VSSVADFLAVPMIYDLLNLHYVYSYQRVACVTFRSNRKNVDLGLNACSLTLDFVKLFSRMLCLGVILFL
jgi:hypothetical protein